MQKKQHKQIKCDLCIQHGYCKSEAMIAGHGYIFYCVHFKHFKKKYLILLQKVNNIINKLKCLFK